jgi:hypothetical protein
MYNNKKTYLCKICFQWSCERRCNEIPVTDKNVALMAGDRIIMANCRQAVNARCGGQQWYYGNW